MSKTRMTLQAKTVLRMLAADPGREVYGLEIIRATGLISGSVYPLLGRLESSGWLTSRAEQITPATEGRPPRRYYRITPAGIAQARALPPAQASPAEKALARGMLQIADTADMPDSFWQADRRIRLAREVLGVPDDGRYTHSALWEAETRDEAARA
jgi:DNA-binding PadR family transcriptional regulator